MAEGSSGRATVLAGLLIGLGVIVGAFVVASALDRTAVQLEEVAGALDTRALAGERPQAPSRPSGPRRPAQPAQGERFDVELGEAPLRGDEDAAITIVEFSDFQCPFCSRAQPTLEQIEQEYGDDVRIAFKHLPLSIHPQAPAAHAAAEAAHRQGRFWEMHDRIFENQRDLAPATFERYAQDLGLDMDRFRRDVASESVEQRIEADKRQAADLGVSGTPAFFINGRFISGAQPFFRFKSIIDEALEKQT